MDDKQDGLQTHCRTFSLKKEGDADTCYNRDEPSGHYAKWNSQSQRTQAVGFPSQKVLAAVTFMGKESRVVDSRGWGRGYEELVRSGYRASVLQDGVLWVGGAHGCTTVRPLLTAPNCT